MTIDGIGSAFCASILTSAVWWLWVNRTRKPPIEAMRPIAIDYTNWRGERRERVIEPVDLVFKKSPWHEKPQWFVEAYDAPKPTDTMGDAAAATLKDFALVNIHGWIDPHALDSDR